MTSSQKTLCSVVLNVEWTDISHIHFTKTLLQASSLIIPYFISISTIFRQVLHAMRQETWEKHSEIALIFVSLHRTSDPSVFQSSLVIAGWVSFFKSWKIPRFSSDIMSPFCHHRFQIWWFMGVPTPKFLFKNTYFQEIFHFFRIK